MHRALLSACLAVTIGACASAAGDASQTEPGTDVARVDRLAPLRFLVGHCWRGTFPDGKKIDTHCYEPMYGAAFVRDRHVVTGGSAPYRGETIYSYDPVQDRIIYRYFSSVGGVSDGIAVPGDGRIAFPGEAHRTADGELIEIRSVIEPVGDDGYVSLAEQKTASGWQEIWRIEFSRVAPSTGEGPAARQQAPALATLAPLVGDWGDPDEVSAAKKNGVEPPVRFSYRWGPRRMLLRTFENLAEPFADGVFDPVLEGMLFHDHVGAATRFVASTRYGWSFDGRYAVGDDGVIERVYDVHYAADDPYMPDPDRGGQVRRFRERFEPVGNDRLSIRLDLWVDGEWQPFGPGRYEAVRIGA